MCIRDSFYDVDYKLQGTPLVSILIPNKDQADTLRTCLESIKKKCMYPSYEILIIENNSTEEATFSYYKELEAQGIRVLKYPKPVSYTHLCLPLEWAFVSCRITMRMDLS